MNIEFMCANAQEIVDFVADEFVVDDFADDDE